MAMTFKNANILSLSRTVLRQLSSDADPMSKFQGLPMFPSFKSVEDERLHIKQRLAASFRLFSKMGFDEGVAGHITARDPEFKHTFWVNPFGVHFSQVKVSNLIRCDHDGNVVEGKYPVNAAAYAIHSTLHKQRQDVGAAAHTHSKHGRAWSTLGRKLDMITQDSCAFYNDHVLYDNFEGVVLELDEGLNIAKSLGMKKAAILQNHGLLTVGQSVDAAVWWYIALERCCEVQLIAESVSRNNDLKKIPHKAAETTYSVVGSNFAGWFQFQPLYARILKEQPDFLD